MPRIVSGLVDLTRAAVGRALADGALTGFDLPADVAFSRPRNPDWGDYSTGLALALAGAARRSPMDVAREIDIRIADSLVVARRSVSAPGPWN